MRFSRASALVSALAGLSAAQTSTKCNPLTAQCPADPALGGTASIDFTSGASNDFTASGNSISYGSNGAQMTVAKSGDSPLLVSNWYLMFGKVDVVMQAAPGTGMVSSSTLESDDLDEIDWEVLGYQPQEVQTNYFGKGNTAPSSVRGGTSADPDNQSTFKTYSVEWTSTEIVWSIDGETIRVLQAADADGQYPQTPMRLKIGPWAGGDPSNAQGTQSWAGGTIDYADGPFSMYVKSVSAQDYSTGTSYSYSGTDGTWQEVKAAGGSVSGGPSTVDTAAPAVTSTTGQPVPFDGTHAQPSSTFSTPSIYPWVSAPSTLSSVSSAATSIPGLPAGWSVSSSGKVLPPSSAPSSSPSASSTSSPPPSSSAAGAASGSGSELVTPAPAAPAMPAMPSGGAASSAGFLTTTNGTFTSSSATASAAPASFTAGAGVHGAAVGAAALALGALGLSL